MAWFAIAILALVLAALLVALLNRFYVKATRDAAVIRTGAGGRRIVVDGGVIVFPFMHRSERVSMRSMRLASELTGRRAPITVDRLRVDLELEVHVRVDPAPEGIALAAQTLGPKAFRDDEMQALLLPKIVDAVQAEVARRTLDTLHEDRTGFVAAIAEALSANLAAYGLMVDGVSLTRLDQTPFTSLDDGNVFNAVGMRRLAEMIAENRKARVAVEAEAEIAVARRRLEQTTERLALERRQDEAETARRLETEQRRIAADSQVEAAREASARLVEEARIERLRETKQAEIERDLHLRRRELEALAEIEVRKLDNAIQVAVKRAEETEEQARAELARARIVEAQESVQTARELAAAERARRLAVMRATQEGEVEDHRVRSQVSSVLSLAQAEGKAAALRGDGERERLVAEAQGRRALIEAENTQSEAVLRAGLERYRIDAMPAIAAQMMKPVEKIESIRINQLAGFGQSAPGGGGGSPFDQALESILGMSVKLPLMKRIGDEIGLEFDAQLAGRTADAAGRAAPATRVRKDD